MATETTSSEEEQEFPAPNPYGTAGVSGGVGAGRVHPESPMDGRAMRRSSRGSFTRASLEDLLSIDPEAYQSSVWLGTEDGWYGGTHTHHARMLHLHTHTHHARMLHLHAHTLCTHVTSAHTHTMHACYIYTHAHTHTMHACYIYTHTHTQTPCLHVTSTSNKQCISLFFLLSAG